MAEPWVWGLLGGAGLLLLAARSKAGEAVMESAAQTAAEAFDVATLAAKMPSAGRQYAQDVLRAASETGVPPLLLAALAEQESSWGAYLTPRGPGGTGDGGHGRGLMQIDDRSHAEWLGRTDAAGTPLWKIPFENLRYGAQVWIAKRSFLARTPAAGATVTVPANSYAASRGVPAGTYHDPRPLSGDALFEAAVAAYNTGEGNVLRALAAGMPADRTASSGTLDGRTMRYAQLVILRMNRMAAVG